MAAKNPSKSAARGKKQTGSTNGPQTTEEDGNDRLAEPVDASQAPRLPFPVVAIGGSAGGIEAFTDFFKAMPNDGGLAFVLIQHLPPNHESMMVDILSRHTKMPVLQVEEGMKVESNHVYVIRPGHTLTIKDGALHLGENVAKPGHSRPIDDFFKSLAEEQQERGIAIVMSGMGSNGSAGAESIKAVGGLCIAQSPETAKFPSMPRHLIDAGVADFVLTPQEMPATLLRYARHPYANAGQRHAEALMRAELGQLTEVLTILRNRLRRDFNGYKRPTIVRRIQRRMGMHQITRLSEYVTFLRATPAEINALADDLMIHVTGFFRDPQSWDALRDRAIAPMIAERKHGSDIRCWVAGCSTGEEAYTLAILLTEAAEAANKHFDIKIFATDTADRTLGLARNGLYPGGIEAEVSPQRLSRFFEPDDALYRVKRELRELVVFAPQNLLLDPPFSRLDIVTCRNLLIYLEPDVQQRILSLLHFGLREGGTLMLGTSETAVGSEDLFEPVEKKWRIYRRVGSTNHALVEFPTSATRPATDEALVPPSRVSIANLTNKLLLEQHTPAAVVVDSQRRVLFYHGHTERFLHHPRGEPTRDLLDLATENLRGAVRTALQQASHGERAVALGEASEGRGKVRRRITVTAVPIGPLAPGYFLVTFQERNDPLPRMQLAGERSTVDESQKVQDELLRIRSELQATIEELQSSNEELQASNEEVTSVNEELQSTNEELETSKEELQSMNEELSTVNSQLQAKMEELERMTSDLQSLLASSDIAVIFLDTHFRIRRFTPATKDLIELIPGDIGRPLSDLAAKFTDPDLAEDAQAVLNKLVPVAREFSSRSGRWYLRRVLPYRTTDNRIDGVVITFVDITDRKQAEEHLRQANADLAAGSRLKDQFLATLSHELRTPLSAILLWTNILRDKNGESREIAEGLAAIQRSAESQKALVDDLLDTSRITSGKLRMEPQRIDLSDVMRSAIEAVAPSANAKGVTIKSDLDKQIGTVLADPDRLRQVIWNLVSNAVKFTPPKGTVDVKMKRAGNDVEINVADNGHGIEPGFLKQIFAPFRQADASSTRRHGGLGLGLAITKQLVEMHGGTIDARSEGINRGSTFTVRLPLQSIPASPQSNSPHPAGTPASALHGVRILFVEDDLASRNALTHLLAGWGAHVTAVSSAHAGLDALQHAQPDLIISDLGMPDSDGFAFVREVRTHENQRAIATVPALALTAFTSDDDRRAAMESGFQRFLGKPVEPEHLLLTLRAMLTPRHP